MHQLSSPSTTVFPLPRPITEDEWYTIIDTEEATVLASQIVQEIIQKAEVDLRRRTADRQKIDYILNWSEEIWEEVLRVHCMTYRKRYGID
jgi:hypothetical protein